MTIEWLFLVIRWSFYIRMTSKWRNEAEMTGMKTLSSWPHSFRMTQEWTIFLILTSFRHSGMRMNGMMLTTFHIGKTKLARKKIKTLFFPGTIFTNILKTQNSSKILQNMPMQISCNSRWELERDANYSSFDFETIYSLLGQWFSTFSVLCHNTAASFLDHWGIRLSFLRVWRLTKSRISKWTALHMTMPVVKAIQTRIHFWKYQSNIRCSFKLVLSHKWSVFQRCNGYIHLRIWISSHFEH